MRGRKPQPPHLKLVRGNPGKRPVNTNAPVVDGGMPDAPDCLDEAAAVEWARAGGLLSNSGIISQLDRAVFAAYCQCFSRWAHAERQINEFGVVVLSPKGVPVVSPWVAVASAAQQAMLRAAAEMGMTPTARSRISVAKAAPANPFEAIG